MNVFLLFSLSVLACEALLIRGEASALIWEMARGRLKLIIETVNMDKWEALRLLAKFYASSFSATVNLASMDHLWRARLAMAIWDMPEFHSILLNSDTLLSTPLALVRFLDNPINRHNYRGRLSCHFVKEWGYLLDDDELVKNMELHRHEDLLFPNLKLQDPWIITSTSWKLVNLDCDSSEFKEFLVERIKGEPDDGEQFLLFLKLWQVCQHDEDDDRDIVRKIIEQIRIKTAALKFMSHCISESSSGCYPSEILNSVYQSLQQLDLPKMEEAAWLIDTINSLLQYATADAQCLLVRYAMDKFPPDQMPSINWNCMLTQQFSELSSCVPFISFLLPLMEPDNLRYIPSEEEPFGWRLIKWQWKVMLERDNGYCTFKGSAYDIDAMIVLLEECDPMVHHTVIVPSATFEHDDVVTPVKNSLELVEAFITAIKSDPNLHLRSNNDILPLVSSKCIVPLIRAVLYKFTRTGEWDSLLSEAIISIWYVKDDNPLSAFSYEKLRSLFGSSEVATEWMMALRETYSYDLTNYFTQEQLLSSSPVSPQLINGWPQFDE